MLKPSLLLPSAGVLFPLPGAELSVSRRYLGCKSHAQMARLLYGGLTSSYSVDKSAFFRTQTIALAFWCEYQPKKLPNGLQVTICCPTLLCDHLPCQSKFPSVSAVPAYDLMFRRHPDLTHLRLLAYRFFQRLEASAIRNEELERLWRRPGVPKPVYEDSKYLVRIIVCVVYCCCYFRENIRKCRKRIPA